MNEFERRLLDTIETNTYIAAFADPNREILYIDGYSYIVDAFDAGGATIVDETALTEFQIVMDSDSDFVALSMSGCATSPDIQAAFTPSVFYNPAIEIQIIDNAAGRQFFNEPALMPTVCGAGGFPFLFPSPRHIRSRTSLTVQAQGVSPNMDFDGFFLAIHGGRIFYKS